MDEGAGAFPAVQILESAEKVTSAITLSLSNDNSNVTINRPNIGKMNTAKPSAYCNVYNYIHNYGVQGIVTDFFCSFNLLKLPMEKGSPSTSFVSKVVSSSLVKGSCCPSSVNLH